MYPENTLRIHSIETMGTQDGPGIRMVVFVQGCGFRCLYCHNPDTFDIEGGKEYHIDEIVRRAVNQIPYFANNGGVTISGGEPLIQRKNLIILFKKLKEHNIHTCLDSNGRFLNNEAKEVLKLTDLVMLDVKHINDDIHKKLTGLSNKDTLKFAEYMEENKRPMWLRYVLVPGWTDQDEYLEKWGYHFKDYTSIERVEILPYHKLGVHKWELLDFDYKLKNVDPPSEEIKQKTKKIFEKYFKTVILK